MEAIFLHTISLGVLMLKILMSDEIEMSTCSNGFKKKLRSVQLLMAAANEKGCLSAHHTLNRNENRNRLVDVRVSEH